MGEHTHLPCLKNRHNHPNPRINWWDVRLLQLFCHHFNNGVKKDQGSSANKWEREREKETDGKNWNHSFPANILQWSLIKFSILPPCTDVSMKMLVFINYFCQLELQVTTAYIKVLIKFLFVSTPVCVFTKYAFKKKTPM